MWMLGCTEDIGWCDIECDIVRERRALFGMHCGRGVAGDLAAGTKVKIESGLGVEHISARRSLLPRPRPTWCARFGIPLALISLSLPIRTSRCKPSSAHIVPPSRQLLLTPYFRENPSILVSMPDLLNPIELPLTRPGFGTDAHNIQNTTEVRINAFRVKLGDPKQTLYKYFVHLTDPRGRSPPVLVKKRIFKKLFDQISSEKLFPVFDGDNLCFSHAQLPTSFMAGEITVGNPNVPNAREESFKYDLTLVDEQLKMRDMSALLLGGQNSHFKNLTLAQKHAALNTAKGLFQALNVAVKFLMSAEEVSGISTRRAFFPHQAPGKDVSRGVILRRGFIGHLRVGTNSANGPPNNLLFSVDATCGAFIKSGNLVDVCREITGRHDLSELTKPDIDTLHRVLRRVRIEIMRGQNDSIVRTIHKFGISSAQEMFETDEGKISVETYFRKHRGINLSHPDYPAIQTSATKKAVYPMELCRVLPNQQYRLKLAPDQQAAALIFQTSRPEVRFHDITQGHGTMQSPQQTNLIKYYGLELAQNFMVVPCRIFHPPTLRYSSGNTSARNGQWNIARPPQRLLVPGELKSWAVMICTQNLHENAVQGFCRGLAEKMNNLGLVCPMNAPPPILKLSGPSGPDIRSTFGVAIKNAYNVFGQMPQIIICITEDKSPLYTLVKHEGDIVASKGVTTQCMVKKHIHQLNDQYLTNLALKVNIKIGGINHSVPHLGELCAEPTMFVGADLSHQNFGAVLKPSIAALVGSMDVHLCKYSGVVAVQPLLEPANEEFRPRSQEPIQNFGKHLKILLEQWKGKFPKCIFPRKLIIFRDGVSEGEFSQVLVEEFLGAKAALKDIGDVDNACKITFIVCAKNHRIRFQAKESEQDKSGNAPAGTIVDREIGDPHLFDFFLQSQGGLKGTSRPCRYIILKDESNFGSDKLQFLINSVCSSYQPATRSVGMAAPAYYADILADRGRMWVNIDDDQSTVISSGHKTQSSQERALDLEAYQTRIDEMMNHLIGVNHTMWWT